MVESNTSKIYPFSRPGIYRIFIEGFLNKEWSERLAGMHITRVNHKGRLVTELKGRLIDQSELAGVLNSLYNLQQTILLVEYQDE